MEKRFSCEFAGRELIVETGGIADQASGAVWVTYGDTVVLATVCTSREPKEFVDFLPLTVDYQEKTSAAGKIPGGFFKREGKPSDRETLTSRMIDRSLRPLFPDWYTYDTQVIVSVLSMDTENDAGVVGLIAAASAITLSHIDFPELLAAARVARIDGKLVLNPPKEKLNNADINLFLSASEAAIVMVEGGANEVPEKEMVEALLFAHKGMQPVIELQKQLLATAKPKMEPTPQINDDVFERSVKEVVTPLLKEALAVKVKQERGAAISEAKKKAKESFEMEDDLEKQFLFGNVFDKTLKSIIRTQIINENTRIDGRSPKCVREIHIKTGVLPRAHGSALFTRGETQSIVTTTLGTGEDEQRIDDLTGEYTKQFLLHYNFPPYSVGEVRFMRGPGRREIGHGALAERAIDAVRPKHEDFPYTIRVVSDILSSNGSSSMATVCGGSLSMMDAGVPMSGHVAGIAMGLVHEGDSFVVLSDILGDEDHVGDMDFKVTGTRNGITALQMDIKIDGLSEEILTNALIQAKEGRDHIISKMEDALPGSRKELSEYAPKIVTIQIKPSKIKDVIGPGGKHIRQIIEDTGAKIDINDLGQVNVASTDQESGARAIQMIKDIVQEAEIGKTYDGLVKRVVDFGAFVEIFKGMEGLVHISELENRRVEKVTDILKEGDRVNVKVLEIDQRSGKIRLSRKALL